MQSSIYEVQVYSLWAIISVSISTKHPQCTAHWTCRHKCSQYTKTFGSKCSKVFHECSHNVSIKCELCPMSSTKVYTSEVALNQHKRGMHGPGWTTACGKNYKQKSHYSHHNRSDCKKCIKLKADRRLERFTFLQKMDLTQESVQFCTLEGNITIKAS